MSLTRHLLGTMGEFKRSLHRTLAQLSPTHPHDWCIKPQQQKKKKKKKKNNEKKVNEQCLLDTPRTVMVNKENYYGDSKRPYKMAKFDKQSLCQKYFFGHDTSSLYLYCMCKVSESFSKCYGTSWFPHVCTKNKHNPCLIRNRKKWLSLQSYHFVKN